MSIPDVHIKSIASWQRILLSSIAFVLIAFVTIGVRGTSDHDAMNTALIIGFLAFMLLASVASVVLAFKLGGTGFGVLMICLNLIPLINMIGIVIVNSMATSRLKKAGYRVGLAGASSPQ